MTVTNSDIREYLGHNGVECKVRIKRNGNVERFGSLESTDRSKDFWSYQGRKARIAQQIGREIELSLQDI